MPVYSVEGKLGTGKTKFCVWRIQQGLLEGRRVASNLDLDCTKLTPYARRHYVRLPDKPTTFDFEAMGHGNPETYNEERNGLLVLDELGTWLNSRTFQDKERAGVIDWLIHARKHGWDVYLIVQDANMIDRQVREALIEYQCRCMNLSRIRIPVVGKLLGVLGGRWGYLPRMHTVAARTGYGPNAIVAERWMYRGDDLHAAYDTRQVFTSNYQHGAHSVLPPWDWKPRELPWISRALPQAAAVLRAWVLAYRGEVMRPKVAPKPKVAAVAQVMQLPPEERLAALRLREAGRVARLTQLLDALPAQDRQRWTAYAARRGLLGRESGRGRNDLVRIAG